jgi:hypothetical protein
MTADLSHTNLSLPREIWKISNCKASFQTTKMNCVGKITVYTPNSSQNFLIKKKANTWRKTVTELNYKTRLLAWTVFNTIADVQRYINILYLYSRAYHTVTHQIRRTSPLPYKNVANIRTIPDAGINQFERITIPYQYVIQLCAQ